MSDLRVYHPAYGNYPLGYYQRKLDDLMAMWLGLSGTRGYSGYEIYRKRCTRN